MKLSKKFATTTVLCVALISAPVIAGPTVVKPPVAAEHVSLSTWFMNLFDF